MPPYPGRRGVRFLPPAPLQHYKAAERLPCGFSGGEGGIRTHGGPKDHSGFRDRPVRPLRHLSVKAVYWEHPCLGSQIIPEFFPNFRCCDFPFSRPKRPLPRPAPRQPTMPANTILATLATRIATSPNCAPRAAFPALAARFGGQVVVCCGFQNLPRQGQQGRAFLGLDALGEKVFFQEFQMGQAL